MTPFLNELVWKLDILSDGHFFLVNEVSFVNSCDNNIYNLDENIIIVPQSLIHDLHKLDGLDYNLINNNHIPIVKQANNKWYIDLTYYDSFLQSSSS